MATTCSSCKKTRVICARCKGKGTLPKTGIFRDINEKQCPSCKGKGEVCPNCGK